MLGVYSEPTGVLKSKSGANHLELAWTPQVKGHSSPGDSFHFRCQPQVGFSSYLTSDGPATNPWVLTSSLV